MKVRKLEIDDAPALTALLAQLGYPSEEMAVRARVRHLFSDASVGCWVAEIDDRIVGLITGHLSWHIEFDSPLARLTALVVDESARGQGVARLLVNEFEEWARRNAALKASLNSGLAREDAHAFYKKLGWQITGARFSKDLLLAEPTAH